MAGDEQDVDEGRPDLVDCHIHFWDVDTQDHGWVTGPWSPDEEAYLGDYRPVQRTFLLDDLLDDYRAHRVTKAVHVQASWGGDDQVDETRWITELARRSDYPIAIVAGCDLRAPDVDDELARHSEAGALRGIRMLSYSADYDLFEDERFQRGLRALVARGLVFELSVKQDRIAAARRLAARVPDLQFVLNHAGMPLQRGREELAQWSLEIRDIARCDNVAVKISGLGMGKHQLTVGSMHPVFNDTLEAFGCDRAMLASNWPVDSLFGSYAELVDSYAALTQQLAPAERSSLWHGTAERIYRF